MQDDDLSMFEIVLIEAKKARARKDVEAIRRNEARKQRIEEKRAELERISATWSRSEFNEGIDWKDEPDPPEAFEGKVTIKDAAKICGSSYQVFLTYFQSSRPDQKRANLEIHRLKKKGFRLQRYLDLEQVLQIKRQKPQGGIWWRI